ncbi:sensor histidine kinase [Paenibacillus sp. GCM10027626]|uniref:cache domain-containing sensor histidine kinase n=1 Tax=Paenibacillus sp. GCM10027626 TaxID=3273411 RepID=UPI00362C3059
MYKQLIAYTQKYRLSYRMIVTNICIAVLPILLLGSVGYFSYIHIMKENALDNMNQFVAQTNNRLEEYFNRVDQLSKAIFYNRNVQQMMIVNKSWQESDALLRNLNSYMSLDPTIKAIGMINSEDFRLVSTGQLLTQEMDYIRSQRVVSSKMQISPPLDGQKKEKGLLAFRAVKSIQQNNYLQNLYIGVLLLDTKWIQQILYTGNLDNKANLYLVNEKGDLVGSSSRQLGFQHIQRLMQEQSDRQAVNVRIDEVNYIYQAFPLKTMDWKFIALINEDKLLDKAAVIQLSVVAGVIVMILIVVLVAASFNLRLTHPITKMADAFDRAASGNLDAKLKFGYRNEITVIQDHYNNMLDQIKKLTDNLLESQQQLHQTEMDKQLFQLNGLQSQINAHFLYNVLHSIRGMSLTNAKREVAMAIDNLVYYFRYITKTDEYVLLYKELEHLERYIAIQKIRFGDRLQFQVVNDPALQGQLIVKLLLQPLVENCLVHGFEGKSGRWIIKIKVAVQDDRLLIKVLDNGSGMSNEKIASLEAELEGADASSASEESWGQGIGLVNIHKRIQIYHGESYGLSIKSWAGRGTLVTVTVPLRIKEDDSNV